MAGRNDARRLADGPAVAFGDVRSGCGCSARAGERGTSDDGALPRPRLVDDVLAGSDVVLVEAAGGYGKTILVQQLADAMPGAMLEVRLPRRGEVDVGDLADRITAAAPAEHRPRSPVTAPADAARLAGARGAAVVVDNAQALTPQAAGWLADVAEEASPSLRVVVAGRLLPAPLAALEFSGRTARLDTNDLRLSPEESRALVERALGATDADRLATVLHDVCAGWPALLKLLLHRIAPAADRRMATAELVRHPPLHQLVDVYAGALDDADRDALGQLAHLPAVGERVADAVGSPGLLGRLLRAGIPFHVAPDGSWRLPPVVAEHVASSSPLDPATARRAGALLVADGDVLAGARLVADSGDRRAAASLIAALATWQVDELDPAAFLRVVAGLGEEADREARVLLHLARVQGSAGHAVEERKAVERARKAVRRDDTVDDEVRFEIEAEHRFQRTRVAEPAVQLPIVEELLRRARPGRPAHARLLESLGVALAGAGTASSLRRAADAFRRAAGAWDALGEPTRAASARRELAVRALAPLGEVHDAALLLECLEESLHGRPSARLACLVSLARLHALNGHADRATAVLDEAVPLGELLDVGWVAGHAAWTRMLLAAAAEDRPGCLEHLAVAERALGRLADEATDLTFDCDAADACARVGARAEAERLLAAARARGPDGSVEVALAAASVAARLALPAGEAGVGTWCRDTVPPGRRWHVALLEAYADLQAGRLDAARQGLEDALAAAARLSDPELPERRERAVLAALRRVDPPARVAGPARPAGPAGPAEPGPAGPPYEIDVLGGFSVRRDGRPLPVVPGRPSELVKRLALTGGAAPVDLVIEAMWPDEAPTIGQRRFKNVLSRARRAYGPVVVRRGGVAGLADGCVVDLARFENEATRVAAARGGERASLARAALALYVGPVLPDDLYDDWINQRREAVRQRALALVDVALAATLAEGQLDEALNVVEAAVTHDALDHDRPLRVARALVQAGRDLEARSLLTRVHANAEELASPVPVAYHELLAVTITT